MATTGGRRAAARRAVATDTDGRVRRAAHNREAIVTALYELVGAGVLEPTAQQVADRAGMTIRSVFRHFSDVESLFASLDARLQAEALPLLLGDHPSGSLEERTRALVQRRSAFFERLAPYKRSGNLQRRRSAFIERQHRTLVRTLRTELLRALPELKQAPADLIEAFDLATSFEAWDRLRSDQRLGRDRAAAVMEHNALALARELTR